MKIDEKIQERVGRSLHERLKTTNVSHHDETRAWVRELTREVQELSDRIDTLEGRDVS